MELHVDLETGSDEQKQDRCVGDVCEGARARHHDDPLRSHLHQEVVFFLHQFSISEIKKARNSYAGWAFNCYLATVGTITTAAATSCSFWEIVMK